MVTGVDVATAAVVHVKVALVAPAAIVALAGTAAAEGLLLESVTTAPPAGAGPFNVSVPAEFFPPSSEVGFRVTPDRDGELTVSMAVWLDVP